MNDGSECKLLFVNPLSNESDDGSYESDDDETSLSVSESSSKCLQNVC